MLWWCVIMFWCYIMIVLQYVIMTLCHYVLVFHYTVHAHINNIFFQGGGGDNDKEWSWKLLEKGLFFFFFFLFCLLGFCFHFCAHFCSKGGFNPRNPRYPSRLQWIFVEPWFFILQWCSYLLIVKSPQKSHKSLSLIPARI